MVPTAETGLSSEGNDICYVWLLDFPLIAGVGTYRELLVVVPCALGSRRVAYTAAAYVTNDAAMAAGRERNGIPKKFAAIDWELCNDQIVGRVRRSGVEFATLGMTLDAAVPDDELAALQDGLNGPSVNWLSIPGHRPEGGAAFAGLFETRLSATVRRAIKGRGFIDLRPSAADPLYRLKAEALGSMYYQLDLTLRDPSVASREGDGR